MAINFTDANALAKEVYGDNGYERLVPESDLLATDFIYKEAGSPGDSYREAVKTSGAGGFGYGGTQSDVLTLPTTVEPVFQKTTVRPYLYGFKQQIGYGLFTQLGKIKSKKMKKQAFVSGTQLLFETSKEAASFQREIGLLLGQATAVGIGVITGSVVSGSGTGTQVWGISTATWNTSILSNAVNHRLDVYDTTGATKRNAANTVTLSSIDATNKRVTLVGNSGELDNIVATDVLHIEGAISNNIYGLHPALSNSTGTYLGISATTYPNWASNQKAFGNKRLSVQRVGEMVNLVASRGQKGELTLYASRQGAHDLQQSLSGQIMLNNNPSSFDNDIMRITAGGRKVVVKVHDYCMPGYAYMVPSSKCCFRVGPVDMSMQDPVTDAYFHSMQGDLGVEMKCWGNQALVVRNPAHCCLASGILNSDD